MQICHHDIAINTAANTSRKKKNPAALPLQVPALLRFAATVAGGDGAGAVPAVLAVDGHSLSPVRAQSTFRGLGAPATTLVIPLPRK